jgi:signal transduction histidine kinase
MITSEVRRRTKREAHASSVEFDFPAAGPEAYRHVGARRPGPAAPPSSAGGRELNSEFPSTFDDEATLTVIREIHDWAMDNAKKADLDHFFRDLASTLCKVFNAKLVAIWDHNHRNKCLVLQANSPASDDVVAWRAIPTETSATGAAIEKRDILFFPDILNTGKGRHFTNPAIVRNLQLKSMLSIPVFTPNVDRVGLVINLCFGAEVVGGLSKIDIKRLTSDLGTYVQYLVYLRGEKIMDDVRAVAAASKGILPLFEGISGSLRALTRCSEFAMFRWEEEKGDLFREAPANLTLDASGKATRWLSESADFDDRFDSKLIRVCVKEKRPLVDRIEVPREGDGQPATVRCPYMAVPILSSSNEVIGVIRCKNPVAVDGKSPSFSSFDLIALKSFSRAVAPSVERFLRLREGSALMEIFKDVSRRLSRAYQLDASLQSIIDTLVEVMHSRFGSIYLREKDTDTFVIRAATDPSKQLLVDSASYEVGEGITGTIAAGELLNFRTKEELRADPRRKGKYYTEVWGEDSTEDSYTLLGVPIFSGEKVIGLWKIENVVPTPDHPEPYYTDEDVQAAQVISCFLEYVIRNYNLAQMNLRQFFQLASTSSRIQSAPDEDVAISVVMIALEEAGFAGALLSLYDTKTKLISDKITSGSTWTKTSVPQCHIDDNDIRAIVLRGDREEFVPDSSQDPRCRNNPAGGKLKAQYILPLRLEEELIGTLQVDLGSGDETEDLELLTLKAFASHLAIAISRTRSIKQTLELTEQIMQSSRFIVAESLSGMAVHSLNHKLAEINNQLQKDLKRPEIREKEFLYKSLSQWGDKLDELETDLKSALRFVRAPAEEGKTLRADLHPEIQASISTWINYIYSNKCSVRTELKAERTVCLLPPEAFREIMAVLLVNAVQAHARRIDLRSYNEENVSTYAGKVIQSAFCLECADNGDGLATSDYEKIFEPTYTTKPKNFGTGLGLFIARRLARDGGGDLEVVGKGQDSKGTTFRLSLPLAMERRGLGKGEAD